MLSLLKKILTTAIILASLYSPSFANTSANKFKPEELTAVKDLENYLNSLNSLKVNFDQITASGDFAQGTFYLKKPGKFLWKYTHPENYFLVSSGALVFFKNEDTGQVTQIPKIDVFRELLLKKDISLLNNKEVELTKVEKEAELIAVHFKYESDEDFAQEIEIIFDNIDKKIKQISSNNQMGQKTTIVFYNQNENLDLSDSLFAFTPTPVVDF